MVVASPSFKLIWANCLVPSVLSSLIHDVMPADKQAASANVENIYFLFIFLCFICCNH